MDKIYLVSVFCDRGYLPVKAFPTMAAAQMYVSALGVDIDEKIEDDEVPEYKIETVGVAI